ncbi:MAG: cohesin domain-containing protein [Oscillospiraceae bacterium]|nr:cohesin domain-containing protein [Oscillospiraceae bacterium]
MKKTLSILIIVMMVVLVVSMTPVFAVTSFTVALSASSTTIEQGKTVDITVSLKNFTPNETGINAIGLTVSYDNTVFNTLAATDFTAKGGWGAPTFNPANGKLATDNSTFMSTDHDMVTIRFTVKSTATVGSTIISIKNVDAADGLNDIYPADQSITVNIQAAAVTPPPANNTPANNNTPAVNNTPNNTAPHNPSTGVEDYTVPAILGVSALALLGYARYRKIR